MVVRWGGVRATDNHWVSPSHSHQCLPQLLLSRILLHNRKLAIHQCARSVPLRVSQNNAVTPISSSMQIPSRLLFLSVWSFSMFLYLLIQRSGFFSRRICPHNWTNIPCLFDRFSFQCTVCQGGPKLYFFVFIAFCCPSRAQIKMFSQLRIFFALFCFSFLVISPKASLHFSEYQGVRRRR